MNNYKVGDMISAEFVILSSSNHALAGTIKSIKEPDYANGVFNIIMLESGKSFHTLYYVITVIKTKEDIEFDKKLEGLLDG